MTEKREQKREVFVTRQGNDCFVVIQPPLTPEEKVGFPTPHFCLYTSLDRVADNGSQVLELPKYAEVWKWETSLATYLHNIADHLGDCALDATVWHVNPNTFFDEGMLDSATSAEKYA